MKKGPSNRKTTSIKIDESIWKKVKIHCITKECEISDYLESLIKKDLKIKDEK